MTKWYEGGDWILHDRWVKRSDYGQTKNPCSEIVLQPTENKGQTMAEKVLYEIKLIGETVFGHKLAVNSKGEWVMEIKGTGSVIAVDKSTVTKVVPFTVSIKYNEQGTEYHYLANAEDGFQVDQFLIMPPYMSGGYQLARITGVDTKSDRATTELPYLKRIK